MASVNKAIIIGHLGRDPETRYFDNGQAVTNCSVATTESWKDKGTGERKEATEWHRLSFFGKLAEIAGEYLKKGSQVYVEGRLHTRKYEKDGVERYSTEIRVDRLVMLGGGSRGDAADRTRPAGEPGGGPDDMGDDIPF